jgi:hypothetical protein
VMGKKKVLVKIQPEGKYGEFPLPHAPLFRCSRSLCYLGVPLSLLLVHILTPHTSHLASLGARCSADNSGRLFRLHPPIRPHSQPPSRPSIRFLQTPLNPSQQDRSPSIFDDGRKSPRFNIRNGRRSRQANQRNQRSH